MMHDYVTTHNATPGHRCCPVFRHDEEVVNCNSTSYQEIEMTDLSTHQSVFGDVNPLPGNKYVTPNLRYDYNDLSYYHDNKNVVQGRGNQGCFPSISPEDVDSVLQSCSSETSQKSTNALQPLLMASQDVNNALQSCTNVTSYDHTIYSEMLQDKSLAQYNVVVHGAKASPIDEESMPTCMECLNLDDGSLQGNLYQ